MELDTRAIFDYLNLTTCPFSINRQPSGPDFAVNVAPHKRYLNSIDGKQKVQTVPDRVQP